MGFAVIVLALFAPVLFGEAYLLPLDGLRGQAPFGELEPSKPPGNPLQGDLLQLLLPLATEVDRLFASGRWPLWSDRLGAGVPLLADPQAQALQPLAAPGRWFSPARATAVTAALRVWLALLFTWLLLRRQGLGAGAAWFGAVAWGLGGFLQLWLGWPLANVAALLPALLYCLARLVDETRRRDLVLLTACVSSLLLSGHPETTLYVAVLGGLFVISRLWSPGFAAARRGIVLRRAGLAAVIAAGIAAPALLPALDLMPRTLRAQQAPAEASLVDESIARRLALRLVPVVAPNAFGNDRYGAYWGADNTNEDAAGFVGTACVLLAALALVPGRSRRPQERLLLAAVVVSIAVVAQLPGLSDLLRGLPGGRVSGLHHRLLLVLGFGLAYVAACELDRWTKGKGPRGPSLLLAIGLALGLAAFHLAVYDRFRSPTDPASLEVLRWGWVHWHLRFLAVAVLLLLIARGRRLLPAALSLSVAAELFLMHAPAHPPQPARLLLPETPALAFVRGHLQPGERLAGEGLSFSPNLAALYGLTDARVYNPMLPGEYVTATESVRTGWVSEVPLFGRWQLPLHDALGVRFVLAPPGTPPPPPLALAFDGRDAAVWERPRPFPRFLMPGGRVHARTKEDARIELEVESLSTSTLAASVLQDGAWRILVDGRRVATPRAAGPFIATEVPAGGHRVDLVYLPLTFVLGCTLAGLAWAALLVLMPRPARRLVTGAP